MSHPVDSFTGIVHPEIKAYLQGVQVDPDDAFLQDLEAYAASRRFPLLGRASGQVCELLGRMVGARRVFELGSGWGYSAFFFARAVGEGGMVIGTEKDAHELTAHAELFGSHPLKSRIDLRQGDAFEVLAATDELFDVVYVDIHKEGYLRALREGVDRLRPGGLFLADNSLWGGRVAHEAAADDASTRAIQEFNRQLAADPRVQSTHLCVGDGLAVAWKR